MSTLDNFARDNNGRRAGNWCRLLMPGRGRGRGRDDRFIQTDVQGPPERWDIANQMPIAPVQPWDPYARMQYGLDVPNRMVINERSLDPYHNPYVPLAPDTKILPAGSPDSCIVYQAQGCGPGIKIRPTNRFSPYFKRNWTG